ncbi:MAG TPA: enoyl-CoA hydratase-related protein [Bosea sp. (in: a-proteobacteria)]|jgi:2-(1,2-epoxy-1,2-dihydrophenyl)acetyl-CoA isomerase|nr:enoyl-CoA hydratase-related protein [Bosea sp. (in: a-proteobacteria)]
MSDPAGEVVITQRQGPVLTVTMNRPKVLNVLDEAMADALVAAFSGLAADASIRAVILAGAGRSFMAGGDLARFQADLAGAPQTATLLIDRFHTLMRLIKAMPQPVIAAVQGPVAGGGVGLAFACDLVVAAEDASFLSAYTKLGTNPDGGTTWTLTQLLGPRRALEFVLLNEAIGAESALRLGLVSRIVPSGELMETARTLAEKLARGSSGAQAATKALVQAATHGTFDTQLDLEKQSFVANAGTADFREGINAFFERRPPAF